MKILWLSHNVPFPPIGGVLQRNYHLLREVASRHDVYLVAFNQKALLGTKAEVLKAKKALESFCKSVDIFPIRSDASILSWYSLVFRSLFTTDAFAVNWLKSKYMSERINEIVESVKFDAVHYDTIGLGSYFHEINNIPKILNHHNVESHMMRRRAVNEMNFLKKMYFRMEAKKLEKHERALCPKFNANLAVSSLDSERLAQITKCNKFKIVPNGVDIEYFQCQSSAIRKNSILFSGRLNSYSNRYGIKVFLRRVLPLLKREIPDIQLVIVGKNPGAEIMKIGKKVENVIITGFVEDIRPYFDKAGVYICPIWDGGGTRLKILDAMAMGKAIVATSIGCEGLDVLGGKNILIANGPEEFVDQIKRVLEDENLRITLGREARKLVEERYSWKIIGRDLEKVYEALD